jgi:hypothetical protein
MDSQIIHLPRASTIKLFAAVIRIYQTPVSATRWQHGSPEMFGNIDLVKNNKIAINSTAGEATEEKSTCLKSLKFKKCFDVMFELF